MRKLSWFTALIAIVWIADAVQAQQITTLGKEVPFDLKLSQSGKEGENEVWLFRDLKGSLAVFYFYRSSNLDSVNRLTDIQALQRKYASQGVNFISVTADSTEKWDEFRRSHDVGFFPIFFSNASVIYYILGAFSDPYVTIIDPRGVLIWRGAPDDSLDQRIADYLEYTRPPLGDTAWIEGRLRKAEQYLTQREIGKAYSIADGLFRMMRGVSTTDRRGSGPGQTVGTAHPMMSRAEALRARCAEAARTRLQEAIELEQQGQTEQAARIVAEIAVRFEDPDNRAEGENRQSSGNRQEDQTSPYYLAALEIGRMSGNLDTKKTIRDAMDNAKGEMLNDEAAGYEEDGYYIRAKRVYEQCVKEFKDKETETQAVKDAKRRIRTINRDKTIQKKIAEERSLDEAWRWLSIADHYAGVKLFDRAREQYRKLIEKHPDTTPAKRAKELLEKLPETKK